MNNPKVTLPLKRDRKIWLYRYELSYAMGYTFMMQFTAMRARTWKAILGRGEGEELSEFVARYKEMNRKQINNTLNTKQNNQVQRDDGLPRGIYVGP